MRVTVTLDDDIHQYLKERSRATRRTMGDVASELILRGFMSTADGRAELARAQAQIKSSMAEPLASASVSPNLD